MKDAPDPSDFWAKLETDENNEITAWHPLLNHSAEVAAVMETLLTRTVLRERLTTLLGWEELSSIHVARLCALAAIHDAGKVNNSFQGQAYGSTTKSRGHVRPIIDILGSNKAVDVLPSLAVDRMLAWFETENGLVDMLLATWAHHGKPVAKSDAPRSNLWERADGRDPITELKRLSNHIQRWFPEAFESGGKPFPDRPAFQHAYNGILTLADWIGSDATFFRFAEVYKAPLPLPRDKAISVVNKLFLDPSRSRSALGDAEIGFDGVLENPGWDPHEIQQQCLDLPLYASGSLTVLESDTGSGKTEAAVARFVRLYQNGLVDGLYFAVPTRSAATQLHARITEIIERLFPREDRPPVIQAVPGYIKADKSEGIALPNFEVKWLAENDTDMSARGWAAESSKRYLAGAIVIGTVDQVLFSALQVSHAHMRAASLLRHFLVVDEVHASDVYMTALMDMVLEQHLDAGGHALLMSATLGSSARVHLTTDGGGDVPPLTEAEKTDYPLLTHVAAARRSPEKNHGGSADSEKPVEPVLKPIAGNANQIAGLASEYAKQGARVLIIRNKVDECRDVLAELEGLLGLDSDHLFKVHGISAPHHSRYAPDDRELLDNQIEKVFGKGTDHAGVIAVCTQTVEQSLDIDADILLTDLCPMDVLLQRIGRLHRHDRDRPEGFEVAQCVVLTPSERDLTTAITSEGKGIKGPHGLGTVYDDLRVIEATWQVLEDETLTQWEIPRHNRMLVERSTHPVRLQQVVQEHGDEWMQHDRYIRGQAYADQDHTNYVGLMRHIPFGQEEFADDLGSVKTRLGEDTYRVRLPEPVNGPFGAKITDFTLSEWQLRDAPDHLDPHEEEPEDITVENDCIRFNYCRLAFTYNRYGISQQT